MRAFLAVIATSMLLAPAYAQQQPANPNANTPAINTPNSPPNPGARRQEQTVSPKARRSLALRQMGSRM